MCYLVVFILLLGGVVTAIVMGLIVLTHEEASESVGKGPGHLDTGSQKLTHQKGKSSATGYYRNAAVASDREECSEIGRSGDLEGSRFLF